MGSLSPSGVLKSVSAIGNIAGGVLPVVKSVGQLAGAFSAFGNDPQRQKIELEQQKIQQQRDALRAQQNLALQQLKERQDAALQTQQDQAAIQRSQLAAQAQADEDSRRAALRRAVARQKVLFGASGIGSAGGSAEAVLLGLMNAADEESEGGLQAANLRGLALDNELAAQKRINVLQHQQLVAQQSLARAIEGF